MPAPPNIAPSEIHPSRTMNDRVFPVQLLTRHFGAEIPPVAVTPEINDLLARNSVVAVGVSGGF